ncbi:MAG TPA: site-2 protease family protein [Candidatus Bathyarchaeia archaeon]|nr:site-2 protease family protein [Candidatus Bathyarchaeia archaeon]
MSVNIGRIIGIPIRIHWTLWLVFVLIAWSLADGYLPMTYGSKLTQTEDWIVGVISSVLLFVSVLLHELSHSYIAKRNGLPIARITLFFFGGVSEMSEEPRDPGLEVRMAAAGPLTSFAIAGVLGGMWIAGNLVSFPTAVIAILGYNALINVGLGAFNLIPAFPLDGGRVLRGSLWQGSRNLLKATRSATRVSEIFSLLIIAAGLLLIVVTGDFFNGIWIIFLGWFIRSGAETSLQQTQVSEALHGVSVEEVMTKNLLTVPPDLTVQQLVNDYFLVHPHGGYPVVQGDQLLGIVTMSSVRSIPRERREIERVSQAMVPFERIVTISPTASAADAMQKIAQANVGRLLVTDGPKILGVITRGDLMKTIQTRQDLGL